MGVRAGRIYISCWVSCPWASAPMNSCTFLDSINFAWKGIPYLDGPDNECELRVVGSGPYKHIHLLVTDSGAAIGGNQVTFCTYGYETIGSFVEYGGVF